MMNRFQAIGVILRVAHNLTTRIRLFEDVIEEDILKALVPRRGEQVSFMGQERSRSRHYKKGENEEKKIEQSKASKEGGRASLSKMGYTKRSW